MGKIRHYQCDCGYQMDFFAGAGIRAHSIALAKQIFSEEFGEQHLQAEEFQKIFLDNVLVECTQCQELKTAARCAYTKQQAASPTILIKDICPTCKAKMRILQTDDAVSCPKCSAAMTYHIMGRWD